MNRRAFILGAAAALAPILPAPAMVSTLDAVVIRFYFVSVDGRWRIRSELVEPRRP